MIRLPTALALLIAFALQIGIVAWSVAANESRLQTGTDVRLKVVPVDPRDLLRGDYVILTYEISRLRLVDLVADEGLSQGEEAFVALSEAVDGWQPVSVTRAMPADGPAIRGTIRSANGPVTGCTDDCSPTLFMDFGIRQFFVPGGAGRELERLRNDQRLSVDVALDANGDARLKRLILDGAPLYEVSMF